MLLSFILKWPVLLCCSFIVLFNFFVVSVTTPLISVSLSLSLSLCLSLSPSLSPSLPPSLPPSFSHACTNVHRGDFAVMFDNNNAHVFHLLELAFLEMCKVSRNQSHRNRDRAGVTRSQSHGELYPHFIRNTMVWGEYVDLLLLTLGAHV